MTAPAEHAGVETAIRTVAAERDAHAHERAVLRAIVLAGLRATPRTLPPKLFYDAAGAALFERICELPEYYLTRAELEILRARAREIAELAGPHVSLVEYGSGAGTKIRLLLDALDRAQAYVPIDISGEQLARAADDLAHDYPALAVLPVIADYTRPLSLPTLPPRSRRVAFFPGSTIGNFHPAEAAAFLRRIRRTVGTDGALVLGVDRRKDPRVLHAAYDDAEGVTAAFNRNVLLRLNRELGTRFAVENFAHRALFDERAGRVEMHLVSVVPQTVMVAGTPIHFAAGESIWTESSYKYDRERLEQLVSASGFRLARLWTDAREQFWVAFLLAA